MTMNQFTKAHEGQSVVYSHPDGGSVSATIRSVTPGVGAHIRYAVPYNGVIGVLVEETNWNRLTLFGDAKFLVI